MNAKKPVNVANITNRGTAAVPNIKKSQCRANPYPIVPCSMPRYIACLGFVWLITYSSGTNVNGNSHHNPNGAKQSGRIIALSNISPNCVLSFIMLFVSFLFVFVFVSLSPVFPFLGGLRTKDYRTKKV